jgi:hypothetical protein
MSASNLDGETTYSHRFIVGVLSSSFGHGHFFLHPFQFIVHHSTLRLLGIETVSKNPFNYKHSLYPLYGNSSGPAPSKSYLQFMVPLLQLHACSWNTAVTKPKLNSMVWVRERTIPTEQPSLIGEVTANFLRIEGATWSAWRIPTAVFSVF